jgi:hypothetical protein
MPKLISALKYLPVVIIFLTDNITAQQSDTNLEIFYKMIDSSVTDLISRIPQNEETIGLELNLGESHSIFNNKIIAKTISLGKKISNAKDENLLNINYVIDKTNVNYGELFRDGFLGDYYLPRNLSLTGSYTIENSSPVFQDFDYSYSDTIRYDNIRNIEDKSFPFTKGEIPSEPFLSSLFEPIVAIGAAAVVVILFFTIRSK